MRSILTGFLSVWWLILVACAIWCTGWHYPAHQGSLFLARMDFKANIHYFASFTLGTTIIEITSQRCHKVLTKNNFAQVVTWKLAVPHGPSQSHAFIKAKKSFLFSLLVAQRINSRHLGFNTFLCSSPSSIAKFNNKFLSL